MGTRAPRRTATIALAAAATLASTGSAYVGARNLLTGQADKARRVIPQAWDDSTGLPPRLMYVPIVNNLPNGNGNATIVSFAWFYMTDAKNNGSSLTIDGQFVTLQLPPTGPTYAYQPGVQGQVITAELTG